MTDTKSHYTTAVVLDDRDKELLKRCAFALHITGKTERNSVSSVIRLLIDNHRPELEALAKTA